MMNTLCILLAVLSIWDYPVRQAAHDRLRQQFLVALREGDTTTMEETCRKGVQLLPDDPTWHYNLACSLAYFPKRVNEAFDELEMAIDLGFRDSKAIEKDNDLKRLAKDRRFKEMVAYAERMSSRPLLTSPQTHVPALGVFGKPVTIGSQNLSWDLDTGCYMVDLKLANGEPGRYSGDLYMNRDGGHSTLVVTNYPGLTSISLDQDGRAHGAGMTFPNMAFPYPVFGNCSQAMLDPVNWRSIPRALMTTDTARLRPMIKFYLSNQLWVFPSNCDTAPVGTNGDVFASITPYWLTSAGRSWSDLPYVKAALAASAAFAPATKQELVRRQLLSPTIQTLIRKTLRDVKSEEDYLTAKAHPTAFPPEQIDLPRLEAAAKKLTVAEIPPLVPITVNALQVRKASVQPELTYATAFAWAFVLRADDQMRSFDIEAKGAEEFAFVQTHGSGVYVKIERPSANKAHVIIDREGMGPTNRVDVAVFGRNKGTGWGAPSYVSFARMDEYAPYSDPALTVLSNPPAWKPAQSPAKKPPAGTPPASVPTTNAAKLQQRKTPTK